MKAGGSWSRVPAQADQSAADPLAGFDTTQYVTDVRVEEDVEVGGEPMDRITGVIDTAAALNGILGTLGGTGASGLGAASDILGDIRAVLYVSQTTHLPMRTLIDMPMHIAGETITMHRPRHHRGEQAGRNSLGRLEPGRAARDLYSPPDEP